MTVDRPRSNSLGQAGHGLGILVPSLVGILLLLVGPRANANEEPPQSAADFFEVVDVRIVNVEVVVTDKKGNPVTGLTRDDFELLEDGEKVPITNFYASQGLVDREPVETLDELVQDSPDAPSEQAPPPDQHLELVIFIDNENISPPNRNRVLEALGDSVLSSLGPSDRTTVVSYDGSINVRQAPTDDARALARVLSEMTQGSARGAQLDLERRSILRELQRAEPGGSSQGPAGFGQNTSEWESILSTIRTFAEQEYNHVALTARMLGDFVDVLAGRQGRKALIYVSDGLSLRPGEAMFQALELMVGSTGGSIGVPFNAASESRQFDAARLFEDLGKRANAGRVTFYTVMATGGRSRALTPAERSAFINMEAGASTMGLGWTDALDEIETSNYRASLEILATSTGGRSTVSTRDFAGALERIRQDLRTYYSLGYEARGNDDDDHRIKVKTRDRSLRVRHRETHRLLSTEEKMSVRTQSALLFGGTENPLGVRVEFGPARKAEKKGQFLVPVIIKFPLGSIVLAPRDGAHEGRVTLYVGARDGKGGVSPVQTRPAPIRIPDEKMGAAMQQLAGYRMMLLIGPGEHRVAVTVRDEIARENSTTLASYRAEPSTGDPAPSPSSP